MKVAAGSRLHGSRPPPFGPTRDAWNWVTLFPETPERRDRRPGAQS